MQFQIKAFALACGLLGGIGLFVATWWAILGNAEEAAKYDGILTKFYLGYSMTPAGSFIGLAWAFGEGLIGGAVFAWLYNRLASMGLVQRS